MHKNLQGALSIINWYIALFYIIRNNRLNMGDADCKNKKTNIFFAKTIDKNLKNDIIIPNKNSI